jgi:hypothetical protein
MHAATHEALIYGIAAGINPQGLEQRTASWLESRPGRRRRVRRTHVFTRIPCYEKTDSLLAIRSMDAYEDEVDGHRIISFIFRGQCVALWYPGANTGSFCMDFHGLDEDYAGADPFWPWQD